MVADEWALAALDMALDVLAARVNRDFADAGVPAILLKGISIRDWLYAEGPVARHYEDVDVLVPAAHLERAGRVLADLGFADLVADVRPGEGQDNARAWRHPNGQAVDLHRSLGNATAPDGEVWAALVATSVTKVVCGQPLLVLGPGARALHIAMHASQHGVDFPKPMQDLRRCLDAVDLDEWREAVRIARAIGSVDALAAGLRLDAAGGDLADRLGLPDRVSTEVALHASSAPELALGFARLAAEPTWSGRARYVGRKIVPSEAFLRDWTPLARRGRTGMAAARALRVAFLLAQTPTAGLAFLRARSGHAPTVGRRPPAADGGPTPLRVLRVYHSAVVTDWRERDRQLRAAGVDVTLVSSRRWTEGTVRETFVAAGDDFAVGVPTVGHHPNVFLFAVRPLWRLMRDNDFDVLDIHEEPCSLAALELLVLRAVLRPSAQVVVYTAQNLPKRYPPPFRWIERLTLRTAAVVYPVAEDSAEVIRAKSARPEVRIVPLGVDRRRFSAIGRTEHAGVRLGFGGSVETRKGVFVALDAVRDSPEWTLTYAGGGPGLVALRTEIDRSGLAGRVRALGPVRYSDMPAFYEAIDLLVVPSLPTPGWKEQFGRVVVEAMASGCPVVASDVGALPEVVGDPRLIVPAGDAGALAERIRSLTADPSLLAELGHEARARSERWDWRIVAQAHAEVYRVALARRRATVA